MKITSVWGLFPVFHFVSEDHENGKAKGPFIWVPKDDSIVLAHELWHVKQFYVWFGVTFLSMIVTFWLTSIIIPFIVFIISFMVWYMTSINRELAAYGESLREISKYVKSGKKIMRSLEYYVYILDGPQYKEKYTSEQLKSKLYDAYLKKSLFYTG